jgi:hypothetical protein
MTDAGGSLLQVEEIVETLSNDELMLRYGWDKVGENNSSVLVYWRAIVDYPRQANTGSSLRVGTIDNLIRS